MRLQFERLAHDAVKQLARGMHRSQSVRNFGFDLVDAAPGRAVVRMRVRSRHKQINGVVHGGVVAALADTAAGLATYLVVPRGTRVATIEMKINYLEGVERGTLVAEARVLRRGRNFSVAHCDVRDTGNRLVATSLLTFSISSRSSKAKT